MRKEHEDIALPGWRFGGRGDGARDDSDDIGMANECMFISCSEDIVAAQCR